MVVLPCVCVLLLAALLSAVSVAVGTRSHRRAAKYWSFETCGGVALALALAAGGFPWLTAAAEPCRLRQTDHVCSREGGSAYSSIY